MESNELVEIKEVFVKTDRTQGNMVILKRSEEDSHYFLMFVGDAEITAIAKEKGLVEPKRPLTHDIYLTILRRTGAVFEKIVISEMRDNTFYAKIYVRINDEEVVLMPVRAMQWHWPCTRSAPFGSIKSCSASS